MGFEQNAFAPPPNQAAAPQRPPSVPDLWDFCDDEDGAGSAHAVHAPAAQAPPAPSQQRQPGLTLAPPKDAAAAPAASAGSLLQEAPQPNLAGSGMGGFEELMAASARPNLMDANPFGSSAFHSGGHVTASSSSSSFELLSLEPAAPAAAESASPGEGAFEPRALYPDFAAANKPAGAALPHPPAAPVAAGHQLSFEDDPAPAWGVPSSAAPSAPAAAAPEQASFEELAGLRSAHLDSAAMLGSQRHSAPPPPTMASMHTAAAANTGTALVLAAGAPNQAPAAPAWAQERPAGPGSFWATHGSGLTSSASEPAGAYFSSAGAKQQPSSSSSSMMQRGRTSSADPAGFVLKDLLSHAVENLRIKNNGTSALAGHPRAPPPSLLVTLCPRQCCACVCAVQTGFCLPIVLGMGSER